MSFIGDAHNIICYAFFRRFRHKVSFIVSWPWPCVNSIISDLFSSQELPIFISFQHKTTLGEAEIQSAVEAAAVIFKKVVLQRRQAAKKATDDGE